MIAAAATTAIMVSTATVASTATAAMTATSIIIIVIMEMDPTFITTMATIVTTLILSKDLIHRSITIVVVMTHPCHSQETCLQIHVIITHTTETPMILQTL